MGNSIEAITIPHSERPLMAKSGWPIIVCGSVKETKDFIDEKFATFSLNTSLSKQLIEIPEISRYTFVDRKVVKLVEPLTDLFLMDFEILFDPSFKLDIVKLVCNLSRNRRIVVQWPGRCDGTLLTYATTEYSDCHMYPINNYDVTVIV